MATPITLPDGRICDCGVGDREPAAHAINCPARTTPEDLAEFFPPETPPTNQEDAAVLDSVSTGHDTFVIPPLSDLLSKRPEYDPNAQAQRQLKKTDRFEANELTGLKYDEVKLPSLAPDTASDADKLRAEEDVKRTVRHGVHTGDMSGGANTRELSGVRVLDCESITIVAKVNPKALWGLGYDVEAEGRTLADNLGFKAEGDVPEKTLEEEGVVTSHQIRKWAPRQ